MIAVRLLVPLAIPRWPLGGGIVALVVDALDVVVAGFISGDFGDHYHTTDKLLDTYYLAIEWVVAFGWDNPYARWPALILFPYRVIGVVLFEITNQRIMLFLFPNLFENWWVYCVAAERGAPGLCPRTLQSTLIALGALLVPKMAQEFLLHYLEASRGTGCGGGAVTDMNRRAGSYSEPLLLRRAPSIWRETLMTPRTDSSFAISRLSCGTPVVSSVR